jgi:lysine biosynthesis protein LysW
MNKVECPICGNKVEFQNTPEENEIINCAECNNRLIVKKVDGNQITLEEAPQIEEDWGE